jgi:outer membrane protein OmpA-like peptidoglycan-associated protein
MTKLLTFFAIVFMISAFYLPSYGQLNAEGLKVGIQFNGLLPFDDFYNQKGFSDSYQFSFLGRGFLRFDLTKSIQAELGGGYGQYQGKDFVDIYKDVQGKNYSPAKYTTDIIPIDFRVLFSFAESEKWSPYIFIGGGGLHYNVKYYASPNAYDFQNPQQPVKKEGWTAIVPAGLGTRIKLGEAVLLELQASFTYTFTENLNYYKTVDTPNDAYAGLGIGLTFQGDRGTSDDDMDGLMKKEEKLLGTDPKNPDTDGDALKDGEEVNKYKTNPLKADTDVDGLTDGDEVVKYKTDPLKADTDGDGLNDKDELMQYKTDPLKADTDGDGLNDADEINKYKTDPLKADTDGDGLNDGQEINKYKTDPLKADTDLDGLKDGEEVNSFKTDPIKKDTDGGTVDDGVEVKRGTNPLDPTDDIVKIGVPIVLEGITFATNKSEVLPESEKVLMGALKTLQTYPDILVEISGHTDNVGSNSSNQKLSQRRADAVKAWLVAKGIAPDRISAVGYGEESPRVANDTSENKRLNRRIEFKRTK